MSNSALTIRLVNIIYITIIIIIFLIFLVLLLSSNLYSMVWQVFLLDSSHESYQVIS